MADMKIKIMHLFPDLLNLYGDKGNIESLKQRLLWRGIDVEVTEFKSDCTDFSLEATDILFLGGGSDREEKLVSERLFEHKEEIKAYAENDGVLVAVCGGFQMLGKYYEQESGKVDGLGILDIYTEQGKKRLISNVVLESDLVDSPVVGFENHGGRTHIGSHTPLGRVIFGNGNNDSGDYEGVVYKNVVATYLHGPLFPKNPKLCDYVLTKALKKKYADFTELSSLDDDLEMQANTYIADRFKK